MGGATRKCFHGVPRIFPHRSNWLGQLKARALPNLEKLGIDPSSADTAGDPQILDQLADDPRIGRFISRGRININFRVT